MALTVEEILERAESLIAETLENSINPPRVGELIYSLAQLILQGASSSTFIGASKLGELQDVQLLDPKQLDVLQFLGDNWTNVQLDTVSLQSLLSSIMIGADGIIRFINGISLGIENNTDGSPKYKLNPDGSAILSDITAQNVQITTQLTAAAALIEGLVKASSAEITGLLKATTAEVLDKITTREIRSFTFVPGLLGSGFRITTDANGDTEFEVDRFSVRKSMTVYELIKHKISHVGGAFLFSPASADITSVTDGGTYYRLNVKEKENNFFTAGALALCQVFNNNTNSYRRYWRAVTSVATDGSWINLSKTDCEAGSAVPLAGDTIVQLGHKTNTALQHARLISSYGTDGAYDQFLEGINSYSLTGKVTQQIGKDTFFNVNTLKIRSGGSAHQVPVDKGMWSAGTYYYYDRVHHAGSWWLCTAVSTTGTPGVSSHWVRQSERSSSFAELTVEKDRITTLVGKQTETEGALTNIQSSITQLAGSIESKVSQTDYNTDKDNNAQIVSQIQSSITQMAGSIESKVSQTEYDTDKDANAQTVSQIQSSITQLAGSIESKVSQTTYAEDQQAVQIQISEIEQTAENISLKVSEVNAGAPNLIINSDFSKGTQDWQLNLAPTFSQLKKGDEPDGTGINVIQISTLSGIYSQLIPFGTTNIISFWVKRESMIDFSLQLKIGTSSSAGITLLTIPLTDQWVKIEVLYNLAAAGNRNIQFYSSSGNVAYTVIALRVNNTLHPMTWTKMYYADTVTISSRILGLFSGAYSAGKFVTTTADSGPWKLWSFPTGRKYTLSFFVRAEWTNSFLYGYENDIKTIAIGLNWQYVKYTFESLESHPNKNIIFYLKNAGTFYLTNIMMVEGENAALWQPSASEIKSDLLATGIDIEKKKVTVTADTFILRDNNGVERAVFNENFKLDAFGNMTINSLRTPFARITNFSTHNFDQYPNAVFVPPAGTGTLTLPNLEKHNGLTINLLFDAFYDSWSTTTAVSEIWKLQGFFMDQNGNRFLDMPFHRMERTFLSITGVWTGTRIMWIVRDKISHILTAGYASDQNTWTYRNVPELIKSGELVCAGVINSSGVFVNQDSRLVGDFTLYKDASCIQIIFPSIVRVNAAGTTSSYTISDNDFHIDVRPKAFNRVAAAHYSTPYRAFLAYQYSLIDISQYIFGDFTFEIRALRDFHQLYNL